jgi:hypothetical protein
MSMAYVTQPAQQQQLEWLDDMLMICTPGGIEGFFSRAGRDRATPRPEGFEITPQRLAAAAELFGSTILGPPR